MFMSSARSRLRGKTETVEDNVLKLELVNVQLTSVEDHALKPELVNVQQDDVLIAEELDVHNWANSFENVQQDVLKYKELDLHNWANSLSIDMDYWYMTICHDQP
ncbi:hypothetical protein FCV25MIE_15958 [Fagus crenata]